MAPWRPIKAITALRNEVADIWPNPDRYIGIIGDADHASRVSDHNPDSSGEVHAIDVGIDKLNVKAFLKGVIGDKRVWYVIHDRKIWSRTYGWRTRYYSGSNPHTHHIHVSFRYIDKYEDDTGSFFDGNTNTGGDDVSEKDVIDALHKAIVKNKGTGKDRSVVFMLSNLEDDNDKLNGRVHDIEKKVDRILDKLEK